MKRSFLFAICGITLFCPACGNQQSGNVPAGQLSAKMIHNPRSAEGINPSDLKDLPLLVFTDTAHDFGLMNAGERVEHEFAFKNTGKSPLIIAGATSSCGCTVPEYSREPIPPGGSGTLKVTFSSAGKQGHILKAISVSSNAYPAVRVLTITADIKSESAQ
jgi:hypothetical protein